MQLLNQFPAQINTLTVNLHSNLIHLPHKFALNFDPCFMSLSPEPTQSGRVNYHCKSRVKLERKLTHWRFLQIV